MTQIHSVKRDILLDTAKNLFYRHGMKRVTVEEICRTADVSKMTFYKYFRDKIDLTKTLIILLSEKKAEDFRQLMALEAPFPEKMEKLVAMRIAEAKDVSREFLLETYHSPHPEIRELLREKTEKLIRMGMEYYMAAQSEGYIRPEIKPAFLLWMLGHIVDMVGDENLLRIFDSSEEMTSELIHFFLYGISARKG